MQIKRLCLSLPEQAPEGAALEAFLAHPDHVLARVSRDISQPDVAIASLEKPMQVTFTAYMLPSSILAYSQPGFPCYCMIWWQSHTANWCQPQPKLQLMPFYKQT